MADVPTVINLLHFRGKGRPDLPEIPKPYEYIGRPRTLSNPYSVRKYGNAALGLYRRWLWDRIQRRHPKTLSSLRAITPAHHLGCWCKPAPCHGDVLVAAWDWCRSEGLLAPSCKEEEP
ncbi:MAG: DUF4326 domain-containing protein [Acidobacteriota bacterium]